jgi:hypothetical protein
MNGVLKIRFTEAFMQAYKTLDNLYQKIKIEEIMQFKHSNALRLFEIAKSWESEAGKKGNKNGEWFFYETIPGLKKKLGIEKEKWKDTNNFHRKVIKNAKEEINSLDLSLKLEYTTNKDKKDTRCIDKLEFKCRKSTKKVVKSPKAQAKQVNGDEVVEKFREEEEKEVQKWKDKYPDKWNIIFREYANEKRPEFVSEEKWLSITCTCKTIEALKKMGLTI